MLRLVPEFGVDERSRWAVWFDVACDLFPLVLPVLAVGLILALWATDLFDWIFR